MALFHYLHLRAFAHETEDPEKVRQALRNVAHGAQLTLEETTVEGSHGNRIRILEGQLKSGPAERKLFEALERDDPGSAARLREEVAKRVDEHLNFYLRLDKQDAFLDRYRLSSSDDAVTLRGKLRAFPGPKGTDASVEAIRALETFLDKLAGGPSVGQ